MVRKKKDPQVEVPMDQEETITFIDNEQEDVLPTYNDQAPAYLELDIEQRSPQWQAGRIGQLTATSFVKATKTTAKGAISKEQETIQYSKMSELATQTSSSSLNMPPPITWGVETEQYAREAYAKIVMVDKSLIVEPGKFIESQRVRGFSVSPDVVIYKVDEAGNKQLYGIAEIKCPNSETHLQYLDTDTIPENYQQQMIAQMAAYDLDWCDFISYDPRQPIGLSIFIKRFYSTKEQRLEALKKVKAFRLNVSKKLDHVNNRAEAVITEASQRYERQPLEILEILREAKINFIVNSEYGTNVENRDEIEAETSSIPRASELDYLEYQERQRMIEAQNEQVLRIKRLRSLAE